MHDQSFDIRAYTVTSAFKFCLLKAKELLDLNSVWPTCSKGSVYLALLVAQFLIMLIVDFNEI